MSSKLLSEPITVAVLGAGGREHAIAEKISESYFCKKVLVIPGNDGIKLCDHPKIRCEKINPLEIAETESLIQFLHEQEVGLVVVSTDDLLAMGLVDKLEGSGLRVFGPRKNAAKIEWSKSFAKRIMADAGVSTAKSETVDETDWEKSWEAIVEKLGGFPVVLKYDGLALGKGVRVCQNYAEAKEFLDEVFTDKKFGEGDKSSSSSGSATRKVLFEEFLIGHEVSVFALTDGNFWTILEPACDHKRLNEGNTGPNTGGMGAYSPVPWLTQMQLSRISEQVFEPVLKAMREQKTPYKGLLYAGLMVRKDEFWVLEFNARFGDPEAQALLPRMESDLLLLLYGVACGELQRYVDVAPLRWSLKSCVNVVVASRGYPEKPETGFPIELPDLKTSVCKIFFSGVKASKGVLTNSGGRVLSVSALADSLGEASRMASLEIGNIRFEGMQHRRDIARVRADS